MVNPGPDKARLLFSAGLLSGLLLASLALTMVIGYRIDNYHQQIQKLENVIESQQLQVHNLTEALDKQQKYVVKAIEIYLEHADDAIEKMTMERFIRHKYDHLIGQEVDRIDPNLVFEVTDRRIFKLTDKEYGLHVKRLVISEILKLWVDVVTAP